MPETPKSLQSRLFQLRSELGISQTDLGKLMGISGVAVGMHEKAGTLPKPKHLNALKAQKPQINLDWLRTGKGEMFETHLTTIKEGRPYLHTIGERVFDWANPFLTVLTVPVDVAKNEELCMVVNEDAIASYSENYSQLDFIRHLPNEPVPPDLRNRGTIAKFHVYGDSMEPNFYDGDDVYCSYVELKTYGDFRSKIRNGYVYVIVAKGYNPMLKRLVYHDGDDFVQCYSDNMDKRLHRPFPIALADILQLWLFRRKYSAMAPAPKTELEGYSELKRGLFDTNKRIDHVSDRVDSIGTGIDDIKKLITGKSENSKT